MTAFSNGCAYSVMLLMAGAAELPAQTAIAPSQPTTTAPSQPVATAPVTMTAGPEQGSYFKLLNVEPAWQITRGSSDCLIGVIDSGFDFFHPALRGQIEPGYSADGVYHTTSAAMIAHGTAVASVIVAHNAEDGGMVGFAPGCRVLAASMGTPEHALVKLRQEFFEQHPDAEMSDFQAHMLKHAAELQAFSHTWLDYVTRTTAEAIRYLVDHGVRVINISAYLPEQILGRFPDFSRRLDDAFAYAIEKDVVIVIGSGNIATEVSAYPGSAETVLVVGATTLADERWETTVEQHGMSFKQGSCYGPRLSVMAPCDQLPVARPHEEGFYGHEHSPMGKQDSTYEGDYEVTPYGATSLATPIVTSLAALVRSLRPDLPATDVVAIIKRGAVDIGEPGYDEMTGHGRVDFVKTLELARDWPKKKP